MSGSSARSGGSPLSPVDGEVAIASSQSESGEVEEAAAASDEGVVAPKYKSVWDFQNLEKRGGPEFHLRTWYCGWCGSSFKGWHATKALNHVTKTPKMDVKLCNGSIPKATADSFIEYRDQKMGTATLKRQHYSAFIDSVAENQRDLSTMFEDQRTRASNSAQPGSVGSSNQSNLTASIASFIFAKGLPFSTAEGPEFLDVIRHARLIGSSYQPPGRKIVSNDLLTISYNNQMKKTLSKLDLDSDVYGISLYGDGATIHRMSMINILAAGVHEPCAVLSIHNTTGHLEEGGKKTASYIGGLFAKWIQKVDPESTKVDAVIFDGASNVQKAGEFLSAKYPRIHVLHGAEHVCSLFFSDLAKSWEIRLLIVNFRRVYRVFGSGAMHSPYAFFMKQSKMFNSGKQKGLLRCADTRMAGFFYCLHRMFQCRDALSATLASAEYKDLKLKGFPQKVETFLCDDDMFDAVYVLLRAVYHVILVMRLADEAAVGGMSKILFYVRRTDEAVRKSVNPFRDLKYFRFHSKEDVDDDDDDDFSDSSDDVDNNDVDDDDSDDDDDDNSMEQDSSMDTKHLGEKINDFWLKRRAKLVTPLSVCGWFCSPIPDIRKDVLDNATGADRLIVEEVIAKLFYPTKEEELGRLIATFWREFDDFQTKSGSSYSRTWIWNVDEAKNGKCHLWHKLYSIPFTKVFGKVACRVCGKHVGMGSAERNWSAVKHLKSGKRSHMSGEKIEMQATVYSNATLAKARSIRAAEEAAGMVSNRWSKLDVELDIGLLNWDGASAKESNPQVPRRLFHAYFESWEFECKHKNDPVIEQRFLQKYGGLYWEDPDADDELCYADSDRMEFQGGRNGSGWCIVARPSGEPWDLDILIDLLAGYEQPLTLNVEVVCDATARARNDKEWEEWKAKKRQKK